MTAISTWSTTAGSNNAASPDGFPEGMAPSGVNNAAREVMAQVRAWYENAEWRDWGHTITYVAATQFKISGTDVTAVYPVGRRVHANGTLTGDIYGTITAVTFSVDTTVTVAWDSGSLSNEALTVEVGPSPTNRPWPDQAGWQLVEYADLTNGGADDLSSYDFTHVLEDGYIYWLSIRGESRSADGALTIRLRNDAGTWLSGATDYYEAGQVSGGGGVANQAAGQFFPYNFSGVSYTGHAAVTFDHDIWIRGAMDTAIRTKLVTRGMLSGSANAVRCEAACTLSTIDGHDGIRLLSSSGNFDAGEAFLYRIKEPA